MSNDENLRFMAPNLGKITRLTKKEVEQTILQPVRTPEVRATFDYLERWRKNSLKSGFIFDY